MQNEPSRINPDRPSPEAMRAMAALMGMKNRTTADIIRVGNEAETARQELEHKKARFFLPPN